MTFSVYKKVIQFLIFQCHWKDESSTKTRRESGIGCPSYSFYMNNAQTLWPGSISWNKRDGKSRGPPVMPRWGRGSTNGLCCPWPAPPGATPMPKPVPSPGACQEPQLVPIALPRNPSSGLCLTMPLLTGPGPDTPTNRLTPRYGLGLSPSWWRCPVPRAGISSGSPGPRAAQTQ